MTAAGTEVQLKAIPQLYAGGAAGDHLPHELQERLCGGGWHHRFRCRQGGTGSDQAVLHPGGGEVTVVVDAEITALLRFLQVQRKHVLGVLDGLDDQALRRAVLPSGWNCLGMVQHLTVGVERFWFQAVVAGDKEVIAGLDKLGSSWQVQAGISAAEVLDRYRAEVARADAVITASAADDVLAWWPPDSDGVHGEPYLHTVRDVLLHVITETACHAGHLDAVRELIDGRQWLVNTLINSSVGVVRYRFG
jgi:Protein of unknown function (DUF664)